MRTFSQSLRRKLWAAACLSLPLATGCGKPPKTTTGQLPGNGSIPDGGVIAEETLSADQYKPSSEYFQCMSQEESHRFSSTPAPGACAPELNPDRYGEATHQELGNVRAVVIDTGETDAAVAAGYADTCCYYFERYAIKGRPLVDGGGARVAAVRRGAGWTTDVRVGVVPAPLRQALAAEWRSAAQMEHASIASFARATLELLAVGAPPELVEACQRASLDEVRHARLCFALASAYGGEEVGPAPLAAVAPRPLDLAGVARTTFLEGCVGETTAAIEAAAALAACEDEGVRRVLQVIVRDESRHAALAWQVVGWAVRTGGADVAAALRDVAPAPAASGDDPPEPLERFGVLGARGRARAFVDARSIIVSLAEGLACSPRV